MKGKEPWKPSEAQGKWSKKDQVGPKRGGGSIDPMHPTMDLPLLREASNPQVSMTDSSVCN